ncbi:alpha/beta fold hydrolase [Pseudooceanicola sp. CBS1P-1]|uniref:Alpha/beta fold hydrolase n=1 Tax=Pseudooceanicola albus TaxID=2692189 RepID=A0A6L7G973_9RHOB|nr:MULTISPECIES: alpha/beta fold hydrolase [Pseudooceanicola]MBT9382939.1 alpha/beta fold hydrolase [Pseudooceanicola endophyticus]MXN20137.1 alpha/beta fold hydrolase [Pseudooceanicola albus]
MLNTIRHDGPADATPLLIAHGLFGSGRNWGAVAKQIAQDRPVIAVDMRNHGNSFRADEHSYPAMAADLARVIEAEGRPCHVLGHSMGGKASMALALSRPELVARLIVGDIAPVSYGHTQQDFIDAMRSVDLDSLTRRSEAEAQLAAAGVPKSLQSFFTQSLDIKERAWKLNLDALEAEMAKILSFPEDLTGPFEGPTLFLSGSESDYMRPEYRARIKLLFPHARFAKLQGAGHWLHADKPREFIATVQQFLDRG